MQINLYIYGENSPVIKIDPSGLVDVEKEPKELKGMPWYDGRIPGAGKVAQTHVQFLVKEPKVVKKDKCYKLQFEVVAKVWIELDSQKIGRTRGITLKTAYGHEQRHVENFSKIVGVVVNVLTKAEGECHKTKAEAEAAGKKLQKHAQEVVINAVKADQKHESIEKLGIVAPEAGKGFPPIGMMPDKPADGTPWSPNDDNDMK